MNDARHGVVVANIVDDGYVERERVFIRFGQWSERSKNWHTGADEAGVSVFNAFLDVSGVAHLLPTGHSQREQFIGREACVVAGVAVGVGSDGEPVLRDVELRAYALSVDLTERTYWRSLKRRTRKLLGH